SFTQCHCSDPPLLAALVSLAISGESRRTMTSPPFLTRKPSPCGLRCAPPSRGRFLEPDRWLRPRQWHLPGAHHRHEAVNPANKNGAVVRVERLDYRSLDPRREGIDWDHTCAPATETDVSIDANVSAISPIVKMVTRYCFR